MLTQQNTQQLSERAMADASSNNTSPMPIPEDMEEQQMTQLIESETVVLGAIDQAQPSEHDFDGLDRLPEIAEEPAQSLGEVFEASSEEVQGALEDEQKTDEEAATSSMPSQDTGDLERTLAYGDGRSQPAAAVLNESVDSPTDELGPNDTARAAALEDTQLRPYAINTPDGRTASALRVDDDLAYGLSEETHERPISRVGRIITIIVAGLLAAIVAYAITSIILYGGLRLPSSIPTPATQANSAKKTVAQESTSDEEVQQMDDGSASAETSAPAVDSGDQTEADADTWVDEDVAAEDTYTDDVSEAEVPVDGGGEDTTYDDQGTASDVSPEEPAADASAEGAGE